MEDSSQDAVQPVPGHSLKAQYAFQVHDQTMAPATLSVTNGVVKAKRRRTRYTRAPQLSVSPHQLTLLSPRDHAILEAAYLKNSKPDKAERAQIVSQVELGEKEVQVRTFNLPPSLNTY